MRFKSCACGSENCKLIIAECERVDRVPSFRTAPRISDKVKQAAMWDTYTKAVAITAVKSTSKFGTWHFTDLALGTTQIQLTTICSE
jgi:hypothetical protein